MRSTINRQPIKVSFLVFIMLICISYSANQYSPASQAQSVIMFRNPSWVDFQRSQGYFYIDATTNHRAIDFMTHFNPITAVADGIVRTVAETNSEPLAWCLANRGTQVKSPKRHFEIDHSTYRSGYTHMSSFGINPRTGQQWQVGDKIFAGELVGNSGDSGCTAGAHLHFTTWTSSGAFYNPDSPQLWAPFYPNDGWIEAPLNNTNVQGVLRISGWTKVDKAFDVATSTYQPSTAGAIDRVEIWLLDPNGVNPNPRKLGDAIYGTARPDAGGNYGWYFDWNAATVPNGTYLIQPRAVARNGMTSVLQGGISGSVTVTVRNLGNDYNGDGKPDLYAIAKTGGGSGKTDLYVLNGADNYQSYLLATATLLGYTDGPAWAFSIGDYNGDGKPDLYAIAKTGGSSGKTDLYVLNGADNYQSYLLATATLLGYTDGPAWAFSIDDYNGDGKPDLYAIAKTGGSSGKTDLYVLNGADNYQSYLLATATLLGYSSPTCDWDFATGETACVVASVTPTPVTPTPVTPTPVTPTPVTPTPVTPTPVTPTPVTPTPIPNYSVWLPTVQH